ncbi:hypothetical protein E2C01_092564 [Portunus trituberculatus]|uniref:Uncharacterized protein n=1 Tax=Portunus trituberculatus TaxID=210409 RepID=A0A5B7JKK8_PORTR|nr:hypothetical protein [Portunus trituberculatus]
MEEECDVKKNKTGAREEGREEEQPLDGVCGHCHGRLFTTASGCCCCCCWLPRLLKHSPYLSSYRVDGESSLICFTEIVSTTVT